VKTDENETATASMMLKVIPASASINHSVGGFYVKAYPMIGSIGQTITFDGFCETLTKATITWTFGDNGKGTGVRVTHSYANDGQYRIDAICTATDGQIQRAHITIVILKDPLPPGTGGNIIITTPPPVLPTDPGTTNPPPTDPPNQGPPTQDDLPGQNPPCQSQPWQCATEAIPAVAIFN